MVKNRALLYQNEIILEKTTHRLPLKCGNPQPVINQEALKLFSTLRSFNPDKLHTTNFIN